MVACGAEQPDGATAIDDATRADGAPVDAGSDDAGPTCAPQVDVTGGGAIDLDVPAALLQGKVTVDGAPLPDGVARGALRLRGDRGEITLDLGTTGPGHYRALLVPGRYEVRYVPAGCAAASPMPCGGGHLAWIALTSDGVVDLDIPVIVVRGTVRIDGRAVPAEDSTLRFGDDAVVGWASSGDYAVRLIPGDHPVALTPGAIDCSAADNRLPCAAGTIRAATPLRSDGVLDLPITTALVRGRVTAGGAAPAQAGVVTFTADGGSVATAPFDAAGQYRLRLLPGRYDVDFPGSGRPCGDRLALPCTGGRFHDDLAIATDGILDLDVPVALVTGEVRVDGARITSAGTLVFGEAPVAFDAAGVYRTRVWRGRYDIGYVAPRCDGLHGVPCNSGTILRGVAVTGDGVVDVGVATATVRGRVRASGASVIDRGAVTFVGRATSEVSIPWADDGTYAIMLLRDRYDVVVTPDDRTCPAGANLPCHAAAMRAGIELATDGVLDLDVPVISVTGHLRSDGQLLGPGDGARARFRRGSIVVDVAPLAAGDLAVRLVPGAWTVDVEAITCPGDGRAPCTPGRLRTGIDLPTSGVLDLEVPNARVDARVRVRGQAVTPPREPVVIFAKRATVADPVAGTTPWAPERATRLFPGRYLVSYDGGAVGCDAAGRRWPCLSTPLVVCQEHR